MPPATSSPSSSSRTPSGSSPSASPATSSRPLPGVSQWAVGGHSLGGVAASVYASQDSRARGLLFWASYPLSSLAARTDLVVASVSGTKDGLSTPPDIAASRDLPPATTFTAIEGVVHAYFGDYGPQSGDGTPTIDRATAQAQNVTATARFMQAMAETG
ncbi:MAG: alpha/beta hydrolase [Lapillicoccus sp.]